MDAIKDAERLHQTCSLVRMSAGTAASGLLQLCTELVRAGVIGDDAVARIEEAMLKELTVARPKFQDKRAFEAGLRRHLDKVFLRPRADPN